MNVSNFEQGHGLGDLATLHSSRAKNLEVDRYQAGEPELVCGSWSDVNDAAPVEGPTIVDTHHHRPAISLPAPMNWLT
jgi:hypothetical protein